MAATHTRGYVRVFAKVGAPYYPALPHVVGNRVFEGTYDNPYGDHVPSHVFEYSLAGKLLRTLAGHTDAVYSVALSPDGQTAITAASTSPPSCGTPPTGPVPADSPPSATITTG